MIKFTLYKLYQLTHKMPHINLFFLVFSALKNITVAMAMLRFFALIKLKRITYPIRHYVTQLVLFAISSAIFENSS